MHEQTITRQHRFGRKTVAALITLWAVQRFPVWRAMLASTLLYTALIY